MSSSNINSLLLSRNNPSEIINIISKLKSNSAAGVDDISVRILQSVSHVIARPLSHIFNISLSTSTFPNSAKLARVTPILKAGATDDLSNDIPISVLTSLSKIIEKLTYSRTVHFLNNNNIICQNQFEFRKNCSTSMAGLDVIDLLLLV